MSAGTAAEPGAPLRSSAASLASPPRPPPTGQRLPPRPPAERGAAPQPRAASAAPVGVRP
ncbi:MAG: hypothetical protein ACK56I_04980 [bacterium]